MMRHICFAVIACWIMSACSTSDEEQASIPLPPRADQIESESFGVEYLYSDSARVTAQLEAEHVIEKKEKKDSDNSPEKIAHYFDKGIHIKFFNKRGRESSVVSANYGVLYKEQGVAELKGNVILNKVSTGERLETEQLFWDQEKDSIYVERDQFLKITTPDKVITGKGLRTNTAFEPYFIYNISGQFSIKDGEGGMIE